MGPKGWGEDRDLKNISEMVWIRPEREGRAGGQYKAQGL